MHDAQVKSLKLYTYMDGVKGADDLLAEKTAADGAYTIDQMCIRDRSVTVLSFCVQSGVKIGGLFRCAAKVPQNRLHDAFALSLIHI